MKTDFSPSTEKIVFGNDSVVIRKYNSGIIGGRTLDCADYPNDAILAGHVIIRNADGNYAPMPIVAATAASEGKDATPEGYGALPEGASYVGVLYRSIPKSMPAAAIMVDGEVNETIVPYPMTAIAAAFKAACPGITFTQDEEA